MVTELTNENYAAVIAENEKVVIDFYANWCGPCKAMSKTIEDFAKANEQDIKVVKCDVEENDDIVKNFGVLNLPFVAYIKNGELVDTRVGLQKIEDLNDLVKQ